MNKLLTGIMIAGILTLISGAVFACDCSKNCKCEDNCKYNQECICRYQKADKCNCSQCDCKDCNCKEQNCDCKDCGCGNSSEAK